MRLTLFRLNRNPIPRCENFKLSSSLLLLVVLVAGVCPAAYSGTYAVGKCTAHAFYGTISEAVAAVPAGSTIQICPGIYAEQVVINKNLILTGVSSTGVAGAKTPTPGTNNPTIVSPPNGVAANTGDLFNGFSTAAQVLVATPAGTDTPISVNISNLIVDGSNNQLSGCGTDLVGIYYQNASGTIDHVAARFQELDQADFGCQDGLAIYAQAGYGTTLNPLASVTIENNSVHDYDKNGITVDGDEITATVSGNYVVGIGATPLIAQNGIQISDGAIGKVESNTVTDDVYVNPSSCTATSTSTCYSATGILLYDSGGAKTTPLTISSNIVSNAQGGIVAVGDSAGTADYNTVSSNRITTSPAAGPFLLDGIDLCGNNNTATSNIVFNSSGSGVHIDSSCTELNSTQSGNNSMATGNTINEACAGVLEGNGSGNTIGSNTTYNVLQVVQSGDACPVSNEDSVAKTGMRMRLKPRPVHP
jgi:hypothetical protein